MREMYAKTIALPVLAPAHVKRLTSRTRARGPGGKPVPIIPDFAKTMKEIEAFRAVNPASPPLPTSPDMPIS